MSVERHHFWLESPGGAVAACLHLPADHRIRPHPIVICPPFGYEYTHSHRSLLHLADDLATSGFATVRFDYVGTGDSEGDASTPGLVERWIGSIGSVAQAAAGLTGGGLPTLLGLRFGALLAGVAASRMEVQHLVAWHPVIAGKRYIREHEALQGVAAGPSDPSEGRIEAGGFVLSRETADAIRGLDLGALTYRIRGRGLILERDDLKSDGRLAEALAAQAVSAEVVAAEGYLGMMAEPQYTVVPQSAIDTAVSWLVAQDAGTAAIDAGALERVTAQRSTAWVSETGDVREDLVSVPVPSGAALRGVLTAPEAGGGETVVALANSGSVHHVGPNRLYVELARSLAGAGVASLRVDLRNLGDSRIGPCRDENHPYPATAVDDVRAALDWLMRERSFARCIVMGLCSGAYTAFHAGLEADAPVAGVVCLNPLTFQWREGMSLDTPDTHRTTRDAQYYKAAVRNRAKWKKLLLGRANYAYIVRFAFRRLRDVAGRRLRDAAEWAHLRAPGELGRRLDGYRVTARPLRFVFSTNDPGYAILMSEAKLSVKRLHRRGTIEIDFVEGADHTFSREAWRRRASEAVIQAVTGIAAAANSGSSA